MTVNNRRPDEWPRVDDEGDVLLPDPDFPDPVLTDDELADYYYEWLMAEEQRRSKDIAGIRQTASFATRNKQLELACNIAAEARLKAGFAIQLAMSGYYDNSIRTETASNRKESRAIEAVHRACGGCALQQFCDIRADGVIARIGLGEEKNPGTAARRDRLRRRVKNPKNNHFCETNITEPHLKQKAA